MGDTRYIPHDGHPTTVRGKVASIFLFQEALCSL